MESPKPMKDWTVDEVGIWLHCIGLGEKAQGGFSKITGLDLAAITSTETLVFGGLGVDHAEAEKILQHIEFTKSHMKHMTTNGGTNGGTNNGDVGGLMAELDAVKLEKSQLEEQLVIKDKKIAALEKTLGEQLTKGQRGHPTDKQLLAIEHRHEIERNQMKEKQEREIRMKELEIRHQRRRDAEKGPTQAALEIGHYGKKHFKEAPQDPHRYF